MSNYTITLQEIFTKCSIFELYILFSNENYKKMNLLESSLKQIKLGRYSILGLNLIDQIDEKNYKNIDEFYDSLQLTLHRYHVDLKEINLNINLPILSGAIGYLSYDAYEINPQLKKFVSQNNDLINISKSCFYFYENLIIQDHLEEKTYLTSLHLKDSTTYQINQKNIINIISNTELKNIQHIIKNLKNKTDQYVNIQSNFTQKQYFSAIQHVKNYIFDGHIYVMNLTQQLHTKTQKNALEIYAKLREINPSPFAGLFQHDDFYIICSSPERFLNINNFQIETRPIKGTSPRYPFDLKQDEFSKNQLNQSDKDKSELLMIVDLERNDLNQFCELHSVKVPNLYQIESYSTVHHLVATIQGKIKENYKILDCLKLCFPSGSITGSPKQRAIEIIDELEHSKRSVYTGCLGYLSVHDTCDFNILIRTIILKDKIAYFGVGGGITWESEINQEFDETLLKAKALINSLK